MNYEKSEPLIPRCINAGEFFCILESDEEEECAGGEEVEDWGEDDL